MSYFVNLIFFATVLLFSDLSKAEIYSCSLLFQNIETTIEQDQKTWASFKFTNPNKHKADSFTYIVHSLIPFNIFVQNKLTLASAVKNLENPNYIVSASLITEKASSLYASPIGLILNVPKSNLISSGFGDLGVANHRGGEHAYLREKYLEHGLMSPSKMREIISKNSDFSQSMNEVNFVTQSIFGEKISIVGVIIDQHWVRNFTYDVMTNIAYQDLISFISSFAEVNNIPVIRINEEN